MTYQASAKKKGTSKEEKGDQRVWRALLEAIIEEKGDQIVWRGVPRDN